MVMHKVDAVMEAGERPEERIIRDMGRLIGNAIKAGIFQDGAGLHRSAARARVRITNGTPSVQRGPYAGDNELLASFAMIKAASLDHAIELATRLAQAAGKDAEIEIGPVVEGWDIHGGTRPANAPYRFLLLSKGDAETATAAARAILDEWRADGTLLSSASLLPSKQAARSKVVDGKRTWFDGPFAESKELVAGYSILEVPTLDDAKSFTEEYAAILGDNEVDVRLVAD
jgi:hypothetical protein